MLPASVPASITESFKKSGAGLPAREKDVSQMRAEEPVEF